MSPKAVLADRCALYMVLDTASGAIKIGISKQPNTRLGQIESTYNVGTCKLLRTTWFTTRDEAEKYERTFHLRYKGCKSARQGGREWFNLSESQALGFAEWMERSSNQRAFRATTIRATIEKPQKEVNSDRLTGFIGGFFLSMATGVIPIAAMAITNDSSALLVAPAAVGGVCAVRVKKTKEISKTYGLDGKAINPDLPQLELRQMNLWIEKTEEVDSKYAKSGELPTAISDVYTRRVHGVSPDAA